VAGTRTNKNIQSNIMGSINLSPGRPALDATHLDALCELYLEDAARRVLPVTLQGYSYALGVFRHWWADVGPQMNWQLRRDEIERFARELETQPRPQTGQPFTYETRGMILRRLQQLFAWALHYDYVDRDYTKWIPDVEGERRRRQVVPIFALARLMHAAGESKKPQRDQAILAVLIGTGMRRGECCQLDLSDVVFGMTDGGTIHIRHGKGGKSRPVVFDETTGCYLRAYLNVRGAQQGALFYGRGRSRLGLRGLYTVVDRAALRARLDSYICGPHDLRRLFATTWNRGRKGLGYAQPLSLQMGHSGAAMTLNYSLPDIEDVADVYVSPFSFVDLPLPAAK
jgi:integrase